MELLLKAELVTAEEVYGQEHCDLPDPVCV